uniref:Sex differentiation-related protein Rwucmab-3 n=1 Tax=Romanomermis wuchangensis TaxID=386611 RepID=A0A1C8HIP7_9BILA|nr:sex differentiation-related protein Rwucmab-3 [Romanomermis wuchangensis]
MSNDLTKMILDTRLQQEKQFGPSVAAVAAAAAVQLVTSTSRHSSGSSSQGSVVSGAGTLAASNLFGKTYHCQRCLNHGVEVPRKGHKRHCKYAVCECPNCDLVDQRRKLNKAINSEREKNGSPTGNEKADGMSKIKTRNPKCARCSVHSNNAEPPPLKGHKNSCPYKNCDCKKCALVNSRRFIMAKQIHLRRTQKSKPGQRLNGGGDNKRESAAAATAAIGRSFLNHSRHHQNLAERRSTVSKVSPSPDILKPHDSSNDLPPFMPHYFLNPLNNGILHHAPPPPHLPPLSAPAPPPHSFYEYFFEQLHQRHRATAAAAAAAEPTSDSPPASAANGSPPLNAFLGGNAAAFLAAQRRLLQGPTLPLKGAQMNLADNGDSNGLSFMTGSRSLGLPLSSPAAANFYEFFFNAILNTGHLLSSSSSPSSPNFPHHNLHHHHHQHHHAGLSPQQFAAAAAVAAAAATASPSVFNNNSVSQIFDFEQQRLNAANGDAAIAWRHMFLPSFVSNLPDTMRL